MYNFKYNYNHQGGSYPYVSSKNETVLTATFSFGKETSPNQIKEVEKRCRISARLRKIQMGGSIHEFIVNTLGYVEELRENPLFGRGYLGKRELLKVTPVLFGLGFNLKSTTEGYTPLEEMIDLGVLNEYVLTGEYPTYLRSYTGSCLSLS